MTEDYLLSDGSFSEHYIEVTQHLEPEQYHYEFPPRSKINAYKRKVHDDDGYFDECSFTSDYDDTIVEEDDEKDDMNDLLSFINESFTTKNDFISDHQLSPLQLPVQYVRNDREESLDSTGTIQPLGPSSFLSAKHRQNFLERVPEDERINWDNTSFIFPDYNPHFDQFYPSVHPYHTQEKVILIKISKNQPPIIPYDEGYDDCLDDKPIDSHSCFIPLQQDTPNLAATKIQALWRGYSFRKHNPSSIISLFTSLSHLQQSHFNSRLYRLEQKLNEETAMRIAFEKAMENMTVLMDHQHKSLHDRLQQEVEMRQTYELKMDEALHLIKPLESKLLSESNARANLESQMSIVISQLNDLQTFVKNESDQRKQIESKLNDANNQLASLKLSSHPIKSHTRPISPTSKNTTTTTTTTTLKPTRPITPKSTRPTVVKSTVVKPAVVKPAVVKPTTPLKTDIKATTRKTATPNRTGTRTPKLTRPTTPSNILRRTITPTSRAADTLKKVIKV